MVDILKAKKTFQEFIEKYNNSEDASFKLKVVHTHHVASLSRELASKLNLSKEDILLAELIGILHDIGRFEEITFLKQFDNTKFNHAEYGVKMLFDGGLIREFIKDDSYDQIIRDSIINHNKLSITTGLPPSSLLHSKIIRDADKLDNFRVKLEEKVESSFPGKINNIHDIEVSSISEEVFLSVLNNKCVNVFDRKTALDYWICVIAFVFDLNFCESYEIVKNSNYINLLIDKFNYKNGSTCDKMEDIRAIVNNYVDKKIKVKRKQ